MSYENLPGIFSKPIDGNLTLAETSTAPVVVILGTASRGPAEAFHAPSSPSVGASTFGRTDGTLIRGMYEVLDGGAENLRLFRIGAKAAKLVGVGGGITIETVTKDASAGNDYKIFWDDDQGRLYVWRVVDDLLVYDNYPAYPDAAVDEFELSVTGVSTGPGAGDIGSAAYPLTLAQASGISGATYTAGNDGILLSRMEVYEALFNAYKLLENQDIDFVVPMDVYLDDLNVDDMTTGEVASLNSGAPWASSSVYPTPGTTKDVLGELFVQEYNGQWYFWWDMDRDGAAEVFPSVGSSNANHDCFGNVLSASDFHPVNFGYQLADFCFRQSEDNAEMYGVIGMKPPTSWSLKDVSSWVGREPTFVESGTDLIVQTNGTGLLGNRWTAGRKSISGTGLPGHTVNGVDGLAYGGFIATDDGWQDGVQLKDRNDHLVDIGKYMSIVPAYTVMSNPTHATAYVANGAARFIGFVTTLSPKSAPTNKVIPGVRLPFRVSVAKLDALAGMRYTMFQAKSKGNVVSDAPTAARPDSDYTRLSTVRIVKAAIDVIRAVADPFIGEALDGARIAALDTAIDRGLVVLKKEGFLQRADANVVATVSERVQGKANVELILVPAYELRQLSVWIALAAQ